jgi:DNA (cytosine-5)-methyltransferase 1
VTQPTPEGLNPSGNGSSENTSHHELSGYSLVDLFAGCGGLSLGLENAGFQSVYVNELVKEARDSYLINRCVKPGQESAPGVTDTRFHSSDIKHLVKKTPDGHHTNLEKLESDLFDAWGIKHGEIDLVTGGPPCQGYSGIGIRRFYSVEKEDIPSNHLFEDMATVIRHLEPRMFLFENVRGLLTSRWHERQSFVGYFSMMLTICT